MKAASAAAAGLGLGPGAISGERRLLDGRLPPGAPAGGHRRGDHGRHGRSPRGHGVHRRARRARLRPHVAGRLRRRRPAPAVGRGRHASPMADAVVVIAGMEGALASVVGGLTPAPVVAVPTSTGYGAALEGVTALLTMLSACSSGITVVGIDNGYGAACADRPPPAVTEPDTAHRRWPGSTASPGIAGDMALGLAGRRRGGRRRGPRAARPARPSRLGPAVRGRHCGEASPAPGRSSRGDDVVVRTHGAITALIEDAALPPRVAQRALAVFGSLASVESALHRRPVDQVHFHEVGGHDAIIDIVGTAAALEVLGIDEVSASAVATGTRHRPQRPRVAPQPGPGHRPPARGRPDLRARHPVGAHDPDRSRPPGRAVLVVRAAPRHDHHRVGFRWRRRRDGRPAQLHPGRDRTARRADRRRSGPAGARARDQPRRRDGRTAGVRRRRPPSKPARSTPG